jgi:DNA-nicking Smr family endonuclease
MPEAEGGFEIQRAGERCEGLAHGIDRKHLRALRRGELPVERRIDLHGLVAAEARRALAGEVREAHAAGERCLLVVHGRGLHSEGGPVLRDGVVAWLTAPPLAALVMAFATAAPRDGGPGASYVLLRRARRG